MVGPDRLAPSHHVVTAKHGDATVLLNIKAGEYYITQGVGCTIWEMIGDDVPVSEMVRRIVDDYSIAEATARSDIEEFIQTLTAAALVQPV
jgi:hypothetical protein